jgi:hypothetical protein
LAFVDANGKLGFSAIFYPPVNHTNAAGEKVHVTQNAADDVTLPSGLRDTETPIRKNIMENPGIGRASG